MKRDYRVELDGDARTVQVSRAGEGWVVETGAGVFRLELRSERAHTLLLVRDDGAVREIPYALDGSTVWIQLGAVPLRFEVLDEMQAVLRERRRASEGGDGSLKVAMPGRVIQVAVAEGDVVEAGQGVVVVEAMKMENELKAPASGTVRSVHVAVGDIVEAGAVLIQIDVAE